MRRVLVSFNQVCMLSVWCALYAVVILLPVYFTLSRSYGTLTNSYAWSVSAAFLSGTVPIIPEIIMWIFLLTSVLIVYCMLARIPPTQGTTPSTTTTAFFKKEFVLYVLYLSANTTVVMAANVAYVYIAIYQGRILRAMAQVLLAVFKYGWGNFVMDILLGRVVTLVKGEKKCKNDASYTNLLVTATVVNNIIIPCVVVAIISPSCFYNVFSQADKVYSEFSYSTCTRYVNGFCSAVQGVRGKSSYSPPYEYSYQCSSGLITYYAPAFVNLCIVSTVVSPVTQMVVLFLYQRAAPGTMWHSLLAWSLPSLLKPLEGGAEHSGAFLKPGRTFLSIITYLALLLTFGVVFPPLAAALALAVLMTVWCTRLRLGRFLCVARDLPQWSEYLALIERECEVVNAPAVLQHSLWMLMALSCCFYALFLFDTLGDAVGFRGAYWVLIVLPLLPVVMYAVYSYVVCFWGRSLSLVVFGDNVTSPLQQVSGDVEMTKVVSGHAAGAVAGARMSE